MRARLVRIGNSKGVRIPKALIEQSGLKHDVDISLKGDTLVIRPVSHPRAGWAEAFQQMVRRGDDALLDDGVASRFDQTEWEW
ncbi:MAG TPA: AbrB/MazE/SpoVT family DNA-binding domain-containing protein [Pirellulales bacterium]|nr:AbrB/MazE/SpoVT family DNA-binding domain-containing protein [Pirellulales bacterium]